MANTTANRIATEAKQACLDLGMEPSVYSARKILNRGKSAITGYKNYLNRREVYDISEKPYTNEFGEQEAFGAICDRNLEYAENFVNKNMKKFQGGVGNMTDASLYIMKKQREQLNKLKSN